MPAIVLAAGAAKSDTWEVPRHDGGRTGASSGSVPMTAPNLRWRGYLGGITVAHGVEFGLGSPSVSVAATGGRFVARDTVTWTTLWRSDILGPGAVDAIADLDGDGTLEVVTHTGAQAFVLDGVTGQVEWSSPPDRIEIMGAVRVRDIDGDGLPDIYLDNGIGAKYGLDFLEVYSFAGGSPNLLWSLPLTASPMTISDGTDTLIDLDRNGIPEVVLASYDTVMIVDGPTGNLIATLDSPSLTGSCYVRARALEAELDDEPGLEVVLIEPESWVGVGIGPNVSAYKVNVTTGDWQHLWSADAGTYAASAATSADAVSDLDGDGRAEVVFSYRSPDTTGDAWITQVFSGGTGVLLAQLNDARFEGARDLDLDGASELIVATSTGVEVLGFDGAQLTVRGQAPGLRALRTVDPALPHSGPLDGRLALLDRGAEAPLMLLGSPAGHPAPQADVQSFSKVFGLRLDAGGLTEISSYTPPLGAVGAVFAVGQATRPYPQIALGINTGLVTIMDRSLRPTNGLLWLDGQRNGTFLGGYGVHSPPLVGEDGIGPYIVQNGTMVGSLVADARFAGWLVPPLPRWWDPTFNAGVIADVSGVSRLVGTTDTSVAARSTATGAQLAKVDMPTSGFLFRTPLPLRAGNVDLVGVDWYTPGNQIVQAALDLENESVLWAAAPIPMGGYFASSAGDVDGDGVDEWYSHPSLLNRRDAATGALTTSAAHTDMPYSLPMVADFDGGLPELMLQSGWGALRLVHDDLNPVWSQTLPEANNAVSGARTTCGGVARFVTPFLDSPSIRAYDGASGALLVERTLGCGQSFATKSDADAACGRLALLSNATSAADVGGQGPAVIVGGDDGRLYVLDACTLDLRWVAEIGASLTEPVVANVDGDSDDEILVNAADGFLYGLDSSPFPAPIVALSGTVTDPAAVDPHGKIGVTWAEVPGASSYEIALVRPDDSSAWDPPFRAVGDPAATVEVSGALPKRQYRIAVRAIGPGGRGSEGFSLPFEVLDTVVPGVRAAGTSGLAATIDAESSDDVGLDHIELAIRLDQGEIVIADDLLSGRADTSTFTYAAPASIRGAVTFVVRTFDAGGHSATAELGATVADDGTIAFDVTPTEPSGSGGGAAASTASAEPPDRDDDVSTSNAGGCACTTGGAGADGSMAWLMGCAIVVARRRRLRQAPA